MKTICFIGQFPPPIHGLSKALDTLYNSNIMNKEFILKKIDIKNNKLFLINLFKILFTKTDLFYFTISQSKGGNLRDLIILKLILLKHKKCLIHLHGGYYRTLVDNDLPNWQKKLNYKIIRKLDGAIVLGESLRYIFKDMIDDKKIFVVPNCIDDEFLMSDKEFKEKVNDIDNKKIKEVLYLSNFIKTKGYYDVLELAKITKDNKKDYHFNFAGKFFNEEDKSEFLNFINKNELNDIVTYHGIVMGKEKQELLKKSDFFVLLTNYPNEGQPISILEAMGNGMIIITTNHAGIPDIVKDKINGIVVDKKNINVSDIFEKMTVKREVIIKNREDIVNNYKQIHYENNMKEVMERIIK